MELVTSFAHKLEQELARVIVGQEAVIRQLIVAILCNGHVLLEGVPGVAKTLTVRSLAKCLSLDYTRVQFTPDLMPSDVVGTTVFNPKDINFELRKGPIFTQILLADEINRTPPKTQAALLEAMEERQVTIDGETHPLGDQFLVFATQNPIEFEGTYPLPEAQQDRFLLKVLLSYPGEAAETEVLRRVHGGFRAQNLEAANLSAVATAEDLRQLRVAVNSVRVEDNIFSYIYNTVATTRNTPDIAVGASPRAGIALLLCSKAAAALEGRDYVTPDDVKAFAIPVLRHRILVRPEVEIEGITPDRVLQGVIANQTVPR